MSNLLEKKAVSKVLRGLMAASRLGSKSKAKHSSKDIIPKGFKKAISEKNYKKAWKGYREQGTEGTESLLAFLPMMAAEKAIGKEKVRELLWKKVHAPALKADTAIGAVASKVPGAKRLFTVKEHVPWGKKQLREIERSSALAPLVKVRNIAAPILIGSGVERGIHKLKNKDKGNDSMDRDLREKVASTMLRLNDENKEHTKRAQALRFIYKKAELGLEQVPQTFEELEQKLAALVTQDLMVLEKAVELAGGQLKLGELDSAGDLTFAVSAAEKFQADVLGDEIF